MYFYSLFFIVVVLKSIVPVLASKCGCKSLSPCYEKMLELLQEQDEVACIEDASIGTSSITIFLSALQEFCPEVVAAEPRSTTFDKRFLYEVIIQSTKSSNKPDKVQTEASGVSQARTDDSDKPTFIIDAGQEGGEEEVKFALFIIEQLVACEENKEMIQNIKWVIMPSTNPDGLEYSRYRKNGWRKNLKADDGEVSFGVDISRNFDDHWETCKKVSSGFAGDFPGPRAGSEKETEFIKNVINKHKANAKAYLSIRRDGHHIGYPHAYSGAQVSNHDRLSGIAGEIANKVNLRSGGIYTFRNDSIYNLEGKARCGHSVDWAHLSGVKVALEMRMFPENDDSIMGMFQTMPRGYGTTLRSGYFTGVRELYNIFTNTKKYGKLTQ